MEKTTNDTIRLSVIIVVFDMQRAAPRAVQSLLTSYQQGIAGDDYEVIIVENGSPQPLNAERLTGLGPNVRYFYLENPPPSPAYAINYGVRQARGEILCVMVDGAHMLTPGVLAYGLDLFSSLVNPVVMTPAFFLGPGPQMQTIYEGYDEAAEDALLESINWPEDGYQLFSIGVPYRIDENPETRPKLFWFVRLFESNCLFVRRQAFETVGGCNEQFDLPGGGLLLPDLCRQLSRLDDSVMVQLLGEASFHQVHGGISTNTTKQRQREKWDSYLRQYEQIRGEPYAVTDKPVRYYGHMPNYHASKLMKTG